MTSYGYAHDPHDESRESGIRQAAKEVLNHIGQISINTTPASNAFSALRAAVEHAEDRPGEAEAFDKLHPVRDERMYWFLTLLANMGGVSDASDTGLSWLSTFSSDRGQEDDTFNQASRMGFVVVTHNSDNDGSTMYLGKPGRAALKAANALRRARNG